jgi:hypothetical protein
MNRLDLSAARWRKSSRSTDTGGNCVEVAGFHGMIAIRDSKNPDGPALAVGRPEFHTLLAQIKDQTLRHLNS